MGRACPCLSVRTAAIIVGIVNFLVGPIGFLITGTLFTNPQFSEELNFTELYPEIELKANETVLISTLQGLVLNEWVAFTIYYPPIFLTFLVGIQLLAAVHQQNHCLAKLALILNYVLLGYLLLLTIVLMANSIKIEAITPFIVFSMIQCYFLWIVFDYVVEIKHPRYKLHSNFDGSCTIPHARFEFIE